MNAHDPDPFRLLWNLGYRRLVPIVPPDAPLAPGSKMAANAARGKDARGKAPGVKTLNGWNGLPGWTICQPSEVDLLEWRAMGAGAGIVTGAHGEWTLLALDADAKSPDHENLIETTIIEITGAKLPKRVGQAPKAIYVCKVRGNVNGDKIYFGDKEEFEVRSHGQQFVAWGKHRLTGENYRWTAGLPPFDELPEVSAAQIGALMTALQARLPKPARRSGGDTAEVGQASLRGEPAQIEAAIAALPNSDNRFPGRSDYLDVGYAIKAAYGPQREAAAFACFWSWCEKWDGGDNDRDEAEEDWRRMKPPFRRGAQWLYGIAAEYGTFNPAEPWLEDPPPKEPEPEAWTSIFPEEKSYAQEIAEDLFLDGPARPVEPSRLPRREFLYGTQYAAGQCSATIAPTKVGKSSIGIVEALAMASGRPLLGVTPVRPLRVWIWNGEDAQDELDRRFAAAKLRYGFDWSGGEVADRFHLRSGRDKKIKLVNPGAKAPAVDLIVKDRLIATIRKFRIEVLIVDPFVKTHMISENDNVAVNLVVDAWAEIATLTGCAIELVHHTRKLNGAEVTADDGRGASALTAGVRAYRFITKMKEEDAEGKGLLSIYKRLFRFTEEASNFAPPSTIEETWMELTSINLGNGPEGALDGDSVGVVQLFAMPSDAEKTMAIIEETAKPETAAQAESREDRALKELRTGLYRVDPRTGDGWAGAVISRIFGFDNTKKGKSAAKLILQTWIKNGKLKETIHLGPNRHPQLYVEKSDEPDLFGA